MFVPVDFSFPNTPGGAIAPLGRARGGKWPVAPPCIRPWIRFQFSFSTIYTFLDEIVRMIDSEYIISYGDHF